MPYLAPSAVHIDKPLTNLTLAFVQDQTNFIADKVFPVVGVDHQTDKYYEWDRANMNRTGDVSKIAPETELPSIGMALSNSSYTADVYGLAMNFEEQMLANEDAMLNTRSAGAQTLMTRMLVHREEQFASTFFADGVWSTKRNGVSSSPVAGTSVLQWNDASSTPIQDVTEAKSDAFLASGGMRMNTMVVGREVYDQLVNNSDILARLNGGATVTNTALVVKQKLAEIFEVENFHVMDAVKNSSAEGVAESNAYIGGKHAMLCHTPSSVGLMTPAAGLTFAWNSIPGANNLGVSVESYSGDWLRVKQIAERIEVKMAYDMKATAPDLGFFFNGIVA